MAKQSLLWTTLPNGYTDDGKSLRISVLLTPRLDAETSSQELASFPDFVDWPDTLAAAKFTIHFGTNSLAILGSTLSGPNRIDDRLAFADSSFWTALFPDKTFVKGYAFKDLSTHSVLSYSTTNMDAHIRDLYSRLAASADGKLPKVSALLGEPSWQRLVAAVDRMDNDDRFVDRKNGVRDPRAQFLAFSTNKIDQPSGLAKDIFLFQLFHTPSSTPRIDRYPSPRDKAQEQARWLGYKRTPLPKPDDFQHMIDFHQIVAAMSQYPTLLRKLGLVVDFLISREAFTLAADAPLWVDVALPAGSPNVRRDPEVSPRTRALLDRGRFEANPRPGAGTNDYKITNGLVNLDPRLFSLLQADVDGSGIKTLNFARSLSLLKARKNTQIDPVSQQERAVGAPALRNAGLLLVHSGRSQSLKDAFARQKTMNDAAKAIQGGASVVPPALFREDLVRGFRVDVWDDVSGAWHSLCRRNARYDLDDGSIILTVADEEGTVRLAATTPSDNTTTPNIVWLHETVLAWTGWSLCAVPPGKTIRHRGSDHSEDITGSEPELPPGLRLRTEFDTMPGSLPRLRYGRRYWMRMRIVDLAGNSLLPQSKDFGADSAKKNAQAYLRYEPVSAPAIALFKPSVGGVEKPFEGESMERLAIRTFNDTPAGNAVPSTQRARRFAVPPRTSAKEAEHHGMLDHAGKVDAASFAVLSVQDNSLAEEKILSAGPLDTAPVETSFAVFKQGDALPYLPDPFANVVAARLFDLPGFSADDIIALPLYDGTEWPNAVPFKIELLEDPAGKPRFDKTTRTLLVPLPKAERVTLRLSMRMDKASLRQMGIWSWLSPARQSALAQLAVDGQHWMLTPWRELELVHAVQKPLLSPDIVSQSVDRPLAATYALPTFTAKCSIKSTSHLDIRAKWNEPIEDITQSAAGQNRPRTDHAFAVKITDDRSYAGMHEYFLQAPDVVRVGGFFHDRIPKKIHEFHDTRYRRIEYWMDATTKFREFLPASVLTNVVAGETVPTDENIKVTGNTVRTWIPSSAPPPAPHILYVVPTFGWVRSVDQPNKTSWRRGGGLRVYLDRPWNASGYGEMLAVVLPAANFRGDPSKEPARQPLKNFVTQWGNDPVWLSSPVSGAFPKRGNFPLARTEPDPSGKWLPAFAPPAESDQPPGPFKTTGLRHPELKSASAETLVELAPHDVFYDAARQLWYCDIELTWGAAYFPFIRLALARYQPVSRPDTFLSNVVLADFMPLVPDRWLSVTQTVEPRSRHVSVFGRTYSDSSSHTEAANSPAKSVKLLKGTFVSVQPAAVAPTSVVEVWVERFDPAWGEDFGWHREPDAIVQQGVRAPLWISSLEAGKGFLADRKTRAMQLHGEREFQTIVNERLIDKIFVMPPLWDGTITLPESTDSQTRYRVAIAEYEEYLVDDDTPYDPIPTKKDRRLVFIEHVHLD